MFTAVRGRSGPQPDPASPPQRNGDVVGCRGLVVLDVDPMHGGLDSLRKLTRNHAPLPSTLTVSTGSDGLHFYFSHPGKRVRNSSGRLGPGLDIRGDGGYVIAPPSLHSSGRHYSVAADMPVDPLPEWLSSQVSERAKVRTTAAPPPLGNQLGRWARAALDKELSSVAQAPNGTRNASLNRAAFNLGQIVGAGALDESGVISHLAHTAMAIGLGERECYATIASGLRAGMASPRSADRIVGAEVWP